MPTGTTSVRDGEISDREGRLDTAVDQASIMAFGDWEDDEADDDEPVFAGDRGDFGGAGP